MPACGTWRENLYRTAWARSCAAFGGADGARVRLARAVRLHGLGGRSEPLVDRASRGKPDMRLAGRTAIVTGAGSGIGRASAALFAKQGAFVALVDRDHAGLQETLEAIDGAKGEASLHVGDVSEADFAKDTVGDVIARRGRLDVLMAAAGFSCGGTVLTTDPADWDAVFRTNVGGTWLWSRAAVPEMQRLGSGSIITLASQLAIAGGKANSAYIAAKGAIIG